MTDDVIADSRANLERISTDPQLALDHKVQQNIEQLSMLVERESPNLDASYLLGMLCLARAEASPDDAEAARAKDAALDAFLLPFLVGVPPLPPALLPALADRAAGTARAWLEQAFESDEAHFAAVVADLWQRIADNTAPNHDDRAGRLTNLGAALLRRSIITGEPGVASNAIDQAVDAQRRADVATTADGPERAAVLFNLCTALWTRFNRTGDHTDLDEVIDAGRRLAAQPTGDRRLRVKWLGHLATALHRRHEVAGAQEDLDEELKVLTTRYDMTRHADDLALVEDVARQAVAAAEPGSGQHTERSAILGTALRVRHETGVPDVLDEAIDIDRRVAAATPPSHPKFGLRHSYVAISLFTRFQRTRDAADLDDSIAAARVAAAAETSQRPLILNKLAIALHARHSRDHRRSDLEELVGAARAALAETPPADPRRHDRAALLWTSLSSLVEADALGAAKTDIDDLIDIGEELLSAGGPDAAVVAQGLADALQLRAAQQGTGADLERAIAVLRRLGDDDPHGLTQARLSGLLTNHASYTRDRAVAAEAIEAGRQALRDIPADDPQRPKVTYALSTALSLYQDITRDQATLDEAIDILGTPARPVDQALLGSLLHHRFEQTGERGDLDRAQHLTASALDGLPDDDPDRGVVAETRAATLRTAFEVSGDLTDLNAAIDVYREAIRLATLRFAPKPQPLAGLGVALRMRYEHGGPLTDITEAINVLRQALDLHLQDNPARAVHLSNLGAALRTRFDRTDDLAALADAIAVGRDAVAAVSPGNTYWAGALSNLCVALQNNFRRTGATADLAEAIDLARKAAVLLDRGDPDRAIVLSGLGSALTTRYQQWGALADINGAVDACQDAVAATPAGHPMRPGRLTNLVIALHERHARMGASGDLDDAAAFADEAVRQLPAVHPHRLSALNNLGIVLLTRAELPGHDGVPGTLIDTISRGLDQLDPGTPGVADALSLLAAALHARGDLDEALSTSKRAADLTGTDHPARAIRLTSLGTIAFARYRRDGKGADLGTAVEAFAAVPGLAAAAPTIRIKGARAAAALTRHLHAGYAADLLDQAVRLLPEVAPEPLDLRDRQHQLARFAGLASDAAALALSADCGDAVIVTFAGTHLTMLEADASPENAATRAFRLLEHGRGVVLAQTLDSRTDLDNLRAKDADLAAEYSRLRARLDTQPAALAPTPLDAPLDADRHDLAKDYAAVVAHIRQLPGLANFNKPPAIEELLHDARDGAVVMLNVSGSGSHALLLTGADVTAIELPGLTPAAVTTRVDAFRAALAAIDDPDSDDLLAEQGQDTISETLEWLWDAVAAPVLDRLTPAQSKPPRLWWVPGGALSLLPLHAAGYHRLPEPERAGRSVLDRVVSSYTPTVRALRHARQQAARPDPAPGALIVAVGDGEPPLRHAAREAESVRAILPQATVPDPAITEDVLSRLADCGVAHFICHAVSDPLDPSHGRLLLHNDAADPLTVARLMPTNLQRSRLAYLSACQTAVTDTAALLDESIHLASAFSLAGFPHVIATLWAVRDEESARLATAFYQGLRTPTGGIDVSGAARRLRDTVRDLRDQFPRAPSLWAAYTHTGA